MIERNLRAVSGVADIVSFGGEVKTFEVSVNPHQLINYGITALELYNAIANSNINVGGDVITKARRHMWYGVSASSTTWRNCGTS